MFCFFIMEIQKEGAEIVPPRDLSCWHFKWRLLRFYNYSVQFSVSHRPFHLVWLLVKTSQAVR